MAPTLQSSLDISKRATSPTSPGPNVIAIVCGVVGGVLLVAVVAAAFCILRCRRRRQDSGSDSQLKQPTLRHKHTHSDAINTPLLHVRPHWFSVEEDGKEGRYSSSERMLQRTDQSTPLDMEEYLGKQVSFAPAMDATPYIADIRTSPSKSPPRDLPPLTIPPSPPAKASTAPLPSSSTKLPSGPRRDCSICSESSASEYSQASAMSEASVITARHAPLPSMPEYITMSPHDDSQAPARSDTVVIGRLLQERAKRNPKKIAREVSRIERKGSIKPVPSLTEITPSAASSDHSPLSTMVREFLPHRSVPLESPRPALWTDTLPMKTAPPPSPPQHLVPPATPWTLEGPASAVSLGCSTPSTINTIRGNVPDSTFPPVSLPRASALTVPTDNTTEASSSQWPQHVVPLTVPQNSPLIPQNHGSVIPSNLGTLDTTPTIRGLVTDLPAPPAPPPPILHPDILINNKGTTSSAPRQEHLLPPRSHMDDGQDTQLALLPSPSDHLRRHPDATRMKTAPLSRMWVREAEAEAARMPDVNHGAHGVVSVHGHIGGPMGG